MPKMIDLTGQRFGKLTVLRRGESYTQPASGKHLIRWICRCDCGRETLVIASHLRSGNTASCGCGIGEAHRTHGGNVGGRSRTYKIWGGMKERCLNPKSKSYRDYGGRGIRICDRWLNDYAAFSEDMGECPPGYSIERVDHNGNYEPGNCKWIPGNEQSKNRRGLIMIEFAGKRQTLMDWARELNVPYETIRAQYKYRQMPFAEIVLRARCR